MIKLYNYEVLSIPSYIPKEYVETSREILEKMDVTQQWRKTRGAGAKVGIVDTGIDENHKDLKNRIKGKFNSFNRSANVNDKDGHGTHVAGVIASEGMISGVAPEADLYIVKALGDDGTGTDKSVADGIDWLIEQDVDIISMSLGSNQHSPLIHNAIKRAYAKNIICICASGNDSEGRLDIDSIDFPGAYGETVAVGAIDFSSRLANFSSIGNVDIVAFGVNVLSTYKNNSYAILSGTSMATPYISGVIALLQALAKTRLGRRLTYEEVHVVLNLNAQDLGEKGKDKLYGYGEFSF